MQARARDDTMILQARAVLKRDTAPPIALNEDDIVRGHTDDEGRV
jgi:hypothetical protein